MVKIASNQLFFIYVIMRIFESKHAFSAIFTYFCATK